MMQPAEVSAHTCLVRDTAARKGRTRSVAPGVSPTRHLHFGRIRLDSGDSLEPFATGDLETGLICLKGSATIGVDTAAAYDLTRFDAIYVPRDSVVRVTPGSTGCDLAEVAAPVDRRYPTQFVSYAHVRQTPGLHFETGGASARRELNVLIGKNVAAGRIMAGLTFSEPGNWTSWPPHEHAAMLEEAYLFIEMPAPAFGIQLVYTNAREPELAAIVRENDIVLMPQGYHPNVAAPGHPINFVWMMAANREQVDRQYGVVNVHPEFAAMGSGLDAGRADTSAPPR
jgi:5-deoxy-glucuronate isomerase